MKSYPSFIVKHRRLLAFGALLTLFSSFGQTFLISLFVPQLQATLDISAAEFGSFYSLATLISAGLLPSLGRMIDDVGLRRYTLCVAGGLTLACLAMSVVRESWHLLACLLVLRLTGQGLCGHTASTTMARSFTLERGKALSVSSLGYAVGEGLLPAVVVAAIALIGWRQVWVVQGLCVGLLLIPAIIGLLKRAPDAALHARHAVSRDATAKNDEVEWTRARVLRDPRFYLLLPTLLMLPAAVTGLIIHQARLAEFKGWTLATLAFAFTGFALARIVSSLAIGPAIDRYGAARLFPFFPLPMALGILFLQNLSSPAVAWIYLGLTGAAQGMAGGLTSSLWAELYGVRHLGAIKSLGGSLAVFGTALSPALFGWLLDRGVGFTPILNGTMLAMIVSCGIAVGVCRRIKRSRP
ncbi:MAG: MFS transporter [Verrucomicrobiia bacterium]